MSVSEECGNTIFFAVQAHFEPGTFRYAVSFHQILRTAACMQVLANCFARLACLGLIDNSRTARFETRTVLSLFI